MAKVSDVYAGDYVSAAELQGKGRITAHIVEAAVEAVGQDQTQKVCLALRNSDGRAWPRRMVCNKTNALILASAFSDDTSAWPGQAIEVWAEPVQYQGKIVQGIRVAPAIAPRAGNGAGLPAVTAPPAAYGRPGTPPVLDDEIPW